ncbi:MAG: hypothetical protein BWY10_02498 [Chloroflexi bacterium ADurb.Bin180]|nr:MAG: hypothetical protein BWY10_02498 [Chloroflexi bacterium ADurb.Bin180]
MSPVVPFARRVGASKATHPVEREVPDTARIGLGHILNELVSDEYLSGWDKVADVAHYVARTPVEEIDAFASNKDSVLRLLRELPWHSVYDLIERIHPLIQARRVWDGDSETWLEQGTLEQSRQLFCERVNQLCCDENLAFDFRDGAFRRRLRPQTDKSLSEAGYVLAEPQYKKALAHIRKALERFNRRPDPDYENCVKEAVCCMEKVAAVLLGKNGVGEFDTLVRTKRGCEAGQIPPALAECLLKFWAFRGSAEGVAHGGAAGGVVGVEEAEFSLSLTGACVTYLHAKFREEELPF